MVDMLFPNVFMPKLLTTRQNCIGHHLWVQRPGMNFLWKYPCLLSHFLRSSCAMMPACGSPFIPILISTYTNPFLSALTFKSSYV